MSANQRFWWGVFGGLLPQVLRIYTTISAGQFPDFRWVLVVYCGLRCQCWVVHNCLEAGVGSQSDLGRNFVSGVSIVTDANPTIFAALDRERAYKADSVAPGFSGGRAHLGTRDVSRRTGDGPLGCETPKSPNGLKQHDFTFQT
jgi:hypothetical protein